MRTLALLVVLGSCAVVAQSAPDAAVAEKRAAFLKVIDRPRVDLAPAVRPMAANGLRLVQEHFSFSVYGTRVTGLLVKTHGSTGRLPVVIQLHGTGGRKE